MRNAKPFNAIPELLDFGLFGAARLVRIVRAASVFQVPPANVLEVVGFSVTDTVAREGGRDGNALFQFFL